MSCKVLRERIMRESNIEIRKRQESIMRRNHTILLILFLGGGYLVFRSLLTYAQGIFVAAIFLAWYGYLENYLHRYEEHTNALIKGVKGVEAATKVAKSKKK
ncbi:hypothetical protein JXA48_02745 [Candidatus Woesearchaeota archaeon]|nr:hypothetical protein [Candidatus Woesearchaeota archaeon]